MTKGLIIAAPNSGSGKTTISLSLIRALSNMGLKIAPAKSGPDYIDGQYLSLAANSSAINLDDFAFSEKQLQGLSYSQAKDADLLFIEGAMGLFDGGANGAGSSANLALNLGLPIILVIDCSSMAQSIAALVFGFKNYNKDINIAGVILNKVASYRHEKMLREALEPLNIIVLGAIYNNNTLKINSRHLGLTLPNEVTKAENLISQGAKIVANSLDLDEVLALTLPLKKQNDIPQLDPLGQHIAIAKDDCFAFIYQHILLSWQEQGAQISFFSPLNNEAPNSEADAVFLPGGYPEIYAEQLSNNNVFFKGLIEAANRKKLIYGECGGFMVLGEALIDKNGISHKMSGLLPMSSAINSPKRILGYRYLSHNSQIPFAKNLLGHEFHYSTCTKSNLPPLFSAKDSYGEKLPDMGIIKKNIMGSYAHIICANNKEQ